MDFFKSGIPSAGAQRIFGDGQAGAESLGGGQFRAGMGTGSIRLKEDYRGTAAQIGQTRNRITILRELNYRYNREHTCSL